MIDRHRLSALAHAHHPIASPLSDESVARLLDRAIGTEPAHILDLGCGTGQWLFRAASDRSGVSGAGVDLDEAAIARGRELLRAEGLEQRFELHVGDAAAFTSDRAADCVLSVGAAHAFGGLLPTLTAIRGHLAERGTVVIGDGFWEREPTDTVLEIGFNKDEFADLATTVDRITQAGWAPIHAHVSTAAEWDDYEWSWSGSLTEWALDHEDPAEASAALATAREHRTEWLRGYRGVLGFVTFVLRQTGTHD